MARNLKNLIIFRFLVILLFLSVTIDSFAVIPQIHDSLDVARVYELGEVTVTALPGKNVVKAEDNEVFNKTDIVGAMSLLPSVTTGNFGSKNEGTVYIRGFDIRQIQVYIDGIPVSLPYEGYIDLSRFTTADLSRIDVEKGSSSVLYGPNTIGGTINLVSLKPSGMIDTRATSGIFSGNGFRGSLNIGSNLGKVYLQGSLSGLQRKFYPLSRKFEGIQNEEGKERDNSFREEIKASIRIGFTPDPNSEYSVNYIVQSSEKGVPVYAGSDPAIKVRFWQYPLWIKESVYYISKTAMGSKNYLKIRMFLDQFKNQLNSYDDNSYTTMKRPYAFQSIYLDKTTGASAEIGTRLFLNHELKMALHFKNDRHKQYNLSETPLNFADNTFSVGWEDHFYWGEKFTLISGVSYNHRNSLLAQDYNRISQEVIYLPGNSCSSINLQTAFGYNWSKYHRINFSLSRKTRFATMKDRYSYRNGQAIPNPGLITEKALHAEMAYHGLVFKRVTLQPALYYSRIYDVIQLVDNVLPGIYQLQNKGIARFMGGEVSVSCQMGKKLNINGHYAFISQRNLTNPEIHFTGVPQHKSVVSVVYHPLARVTLSASQEYNSKRYSTSYGTISPAFTLTNLRVAASVFQQFSVEIGVNNLFDSNYSLVEGYPEEGRGFYGSLLYKLE